MKTAKEIKANNRVHSIITDYSHRDGWACFLFSIIHLTALDIIYNTVFYQNSLFNNESDK